MSAAKSLPAFLRKCLAILLCLSFAEPFAWAQQTAQQQIAPEKPSAFVLIRPYLAASVPPVRLRNSLRLRDLLRGGKLYLTVQDAIALALENNIDIELDRYGPITDQWNLERAQAGGPLPGVPNATSTGRSVASGQGVSGSQSSAGVSSSGGNSTSGNTVGATIQQIGPTTPTLDPVFQNVQNYSHTSAPQSNLSVSQVENLVQNQRNYTESLSTGLITGGQVTLTYNDSYLNENAPSDLTNPSNFTTLSLSFRHNLLQGFGIAVNSRNITIAKNNLQIDDLTFENEVIGVVVNVLNYYYGLVADYEDLKAKQSAVEVAQRFFEDNKKQVQVGTMAPLDVTTAEAQLASSQQDLIVSQTTLEQQQVQLKNVLDRNGLADPVIAEAEIIPLDHIEVPEKSNVPPLKTLIATALADRPDLAAEQMNIKNLQLTALGTQNGVRPQLTVLAGQQHRFSGCRSLCSGPPRGSPPEGFAATERLCALSTIGCAERQHMRGTGSLLCRRHRNRARTNDPAQFSHREHRQLHRPDDPQPAGASRRRCRSAHRPANSAREPARPERGCGERVQSGCGFGAGPGPISRGGEKSGS